MPLEPTAMIPTGVVVVGRKRQSRGFWIVVVALFILAGTVAARAWESGFKLHDLWRDRPPELALLDVDKGTLEVSVTETGSLESAINSKVKCQVEALLGNVGGSSGTSGRTGTAGGSGTSGTSGASGTQGGGSSGSSQATTSTTASKSKSGGTSKSSGSSAKGSASASASTSSSGDASTGAAMSKRPTIRSFTYVVAKHVPLRGASSKSTQTKTKSGSSASGARGGGGGNRGGGGGGGGAGGMGSETAGSTRIIEIKPEGTSVAADEVVCVLDSASFRDELQAQKIKHTQAKAWVDQARAILEVNEITYREYLKGIYPQDILLIQQYIQSCEIELDRATKTEQWSKEALGKGFRATAQYSADEIELQRATLALKEARGMEERLKKYTGPRLLKSLEAKLQSIKSDMLAQEAAFGIEDDRLRRIERMIANCTIRAPRDGIIVYANESNPWSGRTDVQIQEGVTVREGQALFDLPDPNHMRVKVKINESKMASIRSGQKALIQIEAFPGKPLTGRVTEITPIPAVQGRFSDIRIYFAYVSLDTGGFTGLRPGMTAEVSFFVEAKNEATRVPVQAIRWVGEQAFVAAVTAKVDDETKWDWRPISLGLMNENFAQVVQGLKPGEQVVAKPDSLPAPVLTKAVPALQADATSSKSPQG